MINNDKRLLKIIKRIKFNYFPTDSNEIREIQCKIKKKNRYITRTIYRSLSL